MLFTTVIFPAPELSELETTDVDLMITVCVFSAADEAAAEVATEATEAGKVLGVITTDVLRGAEVDFTGETRTRRTLPSAETLTSLTGTIFDPGGTKWAGRTVTLPADDDPL